MLLVMTALLPVVRADPCTEEDRKNEMERISGVC
jgi:hypothetical protein